MSSTAVPSHSLVSYADFVRAAPAVRDGLVAAGAHATAAGLDVRLIELVKVRAAQINGCAFCIAHHLALARKAGVPQVELDLVAAWRDAGRFEPRIAAALAWTEDLTRLADRPPSEAVRAEVERHFDRAEMLGLVSAIAVINAWNRIAAGLGFEPAKG